MDKLTSAPPPPPPPKRRISGSLAIGNSCYAPNGDFEEISFANSGSATSTNTAESIDSTTSTASSSASSSCNNNNNSPRSSRRLSSSSITNKRVLSIRRPQSENVQMYGSHNQHHHNDHYAPGGANGNNIMCGKSGPRPLSTPGFIPNSSVTKQSASPLSRELTPRSGPSTSQNRASMSSLSLVPSPNGKPGLRRLLQSTSDLSRMGPQIRKTPDLSPPGLPRSKSMYPNKRQPSPSPSSVNNMTPTRPGFFKSKSSSFGGSYANRPSLRMAQDVYFEDRDAADRDDDIPDETVIFNVPLSPTVQASPKRLSHSASPSPLSRSPVMTATITAATVDNEDDAESSETDTRNSDSQSVLNLPRAQTWMNELSSDAQHLTLELERLALESSNKSSSNLSSSSTVSPVDSLGAQAILNDGLLRLPPRSTELDDILPTSKEKAAVLSKTRPSWLPPKSKSEERKHLREYRKMIQSYMDSERKRADLRNKDYERKLQERDHDVRLWEEHVVPHFNSAIKEPQTRELWWHGVPNKYRPFVWKTRIGNGLQLNHEAFHTALRRAKTAQAKTKQESSQKNSQEYRQNSQLFDAIRQGVTSTLPHLGMFQDNQPCHQALENLLVAYAFYQTNVGYVMGINTVAATLLLYFKIEDAFICLANILNSPLICALHTQDEAVLATSYGNFTEVFRKKLPALHAHFEAVDVEPASFIEPLLTPILTIHASLETCTRVWDIMLFEGDSFLLRAVLGILKLLEPRLYLNKQEILNVIGWTASSTTVIPELCDTDVFISTVRSILRNGNNNDNTTTSIQ